MSATPSYAHGLEPSRDEIAKHNARARVTRARKQALVAEARAKARRVLDEERALTRRGLRRKSRS